MKSDTTVSSPLILIADDDEELVRALAARCRQLRIETLEAYDALAALSLIARYRPDLVILDVNMPAGDGLSVREMMASDPRWSAIPVIVLTGRTDEQTIRRCHDTCAFYVLKGGSIWERVEPLLSELLGTPASVIAADEYPREIPR